MVTKHNFIIYRKSSDESVPHYERYEVPVSEGMSILEALFYVQDHFSPDFSFRYACRGAICGSCGVTINKVPRLACKTQVLKLNKLKVPRRLPELNFGEVDWDPNKEILIEPLPNMTVINDLVVDMDLFWNFYERVQPYFIRKWNDEAPESLQSPEDAKTIEHLVYCILCGICWTCPVNAKNSEYLGPTALAKGYRFIADTRMEEKHRLEIVEAILSENGVPACEKHYVCNQVCPKNVKPGTAIKNTREKYTQ